MTIGELARKAEVGVETVRYYQRYGLIQEPAKPPRGYRRYPEATLHRLLFIRRAKTFGFSLSDIAELLKLENRSSACESACAMAQKNLKELRERKREIEELERQLIRLLQGCGDSSGCLVLKTLSGAT